MKRFICTTLFFVVMFIVTACRNNQSGQASDKQTDSESTYSDSESDRKKQLEMKNEAESALWANRK